jgi:hypothetical protein
MTKRERYLLARVKTERRIANERWKAHLREHDRDRLEIDTAANVLSTKLTEMNEARAQIGQERGGYATKDNLNLLERTLSTRIGVIENRIANYDGRTAMIGVVFLVLTVAVNIIVKFL